jgi:pimeloyl-ACP methyl ester carboxylesterase
MDEINIGELRIAFERQGEGPPLMLLHGALSDSRIWRRQIEELSDEFTVIAWDAPGCGRSSDPPQSYRLPDYADSLAQCIEYLGLERPHVLGLSFGSGLALELYRRHPGIPRTLVLASAYAGWKGSLPAKVVEQRLQHALRDAESPPDRLISTWIPGLFTKSASPELIEEAVSIMSDVHPAGLRVMAHAFAEADLRDILPNIEVPTLLIYGESDQRSRLSIAEDLHKKIPTSKLFVVPGVGHEVALEAPEIFNTEVRNFLRSNQNHT